MTLDQDISELEDWTPSHGAENQLTSFGYPERCVSLPRSRASIPQRDRSLLSETLQEFLKALAARSDSDLKVGVLEKVLLELRQRVSELENQNCLPVVINTLAPEELTLKKPIWITVKPEDDEFCAIFFDANLHSTGDTQFEAIENLKDLIVSNFRFFSSLGESRLGPGPQKQLAVLQQFVG